MKYYNLVFVSHGCSDRNYLFQLPLNISLKLGEKVFVETIRGECIGICESDSFILGEKETACIMFGTGAYLPIKDVIGWAEKQEGYKCIDFRLANIPF